MSVLMCLDWLGDFFLAQLREEVSSTFSCHRRQVALNHGVNYRLLWSNWVRLSVQFSAQKLLHFEDGFVFVNAELLQKSIVIVFNQAFHNFELGRIVIVLSIL